MGTGSFPWGKVRPGRAADHSPPSSATVMEQYRYTSTHPLGHTGPVTGSFYLFFYTYRHKRPLLAKEGTIQGILLACRNSHKAGTWDRFFHFPSKGRHAEDFSDAWKI